MIKEQHSEESSGLPGKSLSVGDAVAVCVGVVIGAGIFRTPSLVASMSGGSAMALLFWLAGGLITLCGALVYAELAGTYPHVGGDYHYLVRAYGDSTGFLFVWARMTVIQTGSIAMWAFIVGDYLSTVAPLGENSPAIWGIISVVLLTALNIAGIRPGVSAQKYMTTLIVACLLLFAIVAPLFSGVHQNGGGSFSAVSPGNAMIFVLLTYGGWNEAAYLSGEVDNPGRNMLRVLLISISVITAVYIAVNYGYFRILGHAGVAGSDTVAADAMGKIFGRGSAAASSLLIAFAALSSMNGVIITSARTIYSLGRKQAAFTVLGVWESKKGTPVNALIFLAGMTIVLIFFGAGTRSGFVAMVDYTAPAFWLFFLLSGLSLFILRYRDRGTKRPFPVPLYPFVPALFSLSCLYMLYSSIVYTGRGALLSAAVLVAGIPLLLFGSRTDPPDA